jgi:hypothetical protein
MAPGNKSKQRPKPPIGKRWTKGVSGNPSGRPKEVKEVKELARSHMPSAIETLAKIMTDPHQLGRTRVAAAEVLLNRGYGTPHQSIDLTGDGVMLPVVQFFAPDNGRGPKA